MKNSDCLQTSIAIMQYSGVWMPDNLKRPWLYILFAVVFQTFFFVFTVAAEIGYLFSVMGDTQRIVEAAVLLLSHLVQGVKVLNVCGRQRRIKRLINFIEGPEFRKSDPTKVEILEKTISLAKITGQFIICSAFVTAIFWTMVPGLKSEISLPLKVAYPFNINENPMFAIMYAYSAVSVTVVGVNDAAVNYIASGLMVLAAAHLDVLSAELSEIDNDNKKDKYQEAVKSIKYHQNIIKYVNEVASIFEVPIFCQFTATSMIICMTLYKITVTAQPVELMTMIFYLICVFLELLMYCYPGDMIMNKSLSVAEAASPKTWSGELRSRRAMLLCCVRAQRALCINAGGILRASLPTAATIVRAAYSYYAVLQQKMDD